MENRYLEIRFVLWIQRLFALFKYSVTTLDVIEAYCNLADVDDIIIKKLVSQIRQHSGTIITYKEELVYIARKLGVSYSQVEHDAGISKSTQLRLKNYYAKHPGMYDNITAHLSKEEFGAVYRFMKIVDLIREV